MNHINKIAYRGCAIFFLVFWQSAYATVLVVSPTQSLSFGSFSAGTGGGVVMSATGVRTQTGAVTLLPSNTGQVAQFSVVSDSSYSVTLPSSITLSGPGASMTCSQFTSNKNQNTLSVGATLTAVNNQTAGSYSGFFTITINGQ